MWNFNWDVFTGSQKQEVTLFVALFQTHDCLYPAVQLFFFVPDLNWWFQVIFYRQPAVCCKDMQACNSNKEYLQLFGFNQMSQSVLFLRDQLNQTGMRTKINSWKHWTADKPRWKVLHICDTTETPEVTSPNWQNTKQEFNWFKVTAVIKYEAFHNDS